MITKSVPGGTACRISGDEFVCIVRKAGTDSFEAAMRTLKKVLFDNDQIAAVGYSAGKGSSFKELVNSAEKMMYEDKERFYRETGRDSRH